MIVFIFGGLYQGQEEYLKTHYSELDFLDSLNELRSSQNGILFPAEDLLKSLAYEDVEKCLESVCGTVVIAGREIGSGVVPMDPAARAHRDHIGRCYQLIAKQADRVIRVSMGISEVLK